MRSTVEKMNDSRRMNILFTSVGRRVELVRAFRKSFERLGIDGRLIATDVDPLAPAIRDVDGTYMVPRFDAAGFTDSVRAICSKHEIDLIFPLIDPEIPVLSGARGDLEATGARLVVIPARSVEIVSDKWATFEAFSKAGIPVPRTYLPEDFPLASVEYPVFIKPRFGSAGHKTFPVQNADEFDFFRRYVEAPVIQEFLPGPEITNDVMCRLDGGIIGVVSRERIEVRTGEVAKGKTIRDDVLLDRCVQVAELLEAVGPITVQCIRKGDEFLFTEVNPRFAGGVPLAIAAGADLPTWFLASVAGIDLEVPDLGTYQPDLYLTRFDDSYVLPEEERERAASRHI